VWFALLAGLGAPSSAAADDDGWVVLPGASFTPDNGLSGGAAMLRYFRLPRGERPSKVSLQAQGALNGESEVNLDPELWFDHDRVAISIGTRLAYQESAFFGIGNDSELDDREDYEVLRFDGRFELIRRLPYSVYLGLQYLLRAERVLETVPGGALDREAVPGADGGVAAGLGLSLRLDTRDNTFAPHSGGVLQLMPRLYHRAFGSDLDYGRITLDASAFFNPWGDHVIALDGRIDLRSGEVPFDELGMAGGKRYLRGMLEGRFRDRHFATAQVEYRFPMVWRLGAVGFAGLGRVADRVAELRPRDLKYSLGGGLRFAIKRSERIQVRGDYAVTNDQHGFYLTLLEAF
jgi:outer membrane protein assembly factor BamA